MSLSAHQIFDSRGHPTVEASLSTPFGIFTASVPSGASTGIHEAFELRDQIASEYCGRGVSKAIDIINTVIAPALLEQNFDFTRQDIIDKFLIDLDGTRNKSRLGANAILAVSMAVARAGAQTKGIPLYKHIADLAENYEPLKTPTPLFNIINGGVHAANRLDFQEFMVVPVGQKTFRDRMRAGVEIYEALRQILISEGLETMVGDEGGYSPQIDSEEYAISLIDRAISSSSHTTALIALDVAASELYKNGRYTRSGLDSEEMIEMYKKLKQKYPRIFSIEDPFDQDDWVSWSKLRRQMDIQIVGDDLTVTSVDRIQKAVDLGACNTLLLKINQIGTVTEAIRSAALARRHGWSTMVSHRSGETEDPFIADFAVGIGAEFIKSGAPCRTERLCKYNQLLRIEREIE